MPRMRFIVSRRYATDRAPSRRLCRLFAKALPAGARGGGSRAPASSELGDRAAARPRPQRDVAAPAARELARDRQAEPAAGDALARRRCRGGSARRPPRPRRRQARAAVAHLDAPPASATISTSAVRAASSSARSRRARRRSGRRRPARSRRALRRRASATAVTRWPRSVAAARQRAAARAATSASESRSPAASRSPARLSSSSSVTICASRSSSSSAACDVAVRLGVAAALPCDRLQPQPQPGQRRAQLVRRVGDELPLRAHEPLQALGHDVERARRASAARRCPRPRRARRQVALGDAPRGRVEAAQRPRDRRRR